jgi:hypothetical protein
MTNSLVVLPMPSKTKLNMLPLCKVETVGFPPPSTSNIEAGVVVPIPTLPLNVEVPVVLVAFTVPNVPVPAVRIEPVVRDVVAELFVK